MDTPKAKILRLLVEAYQASLKAQAELIETHEIGGFWEYHGTAEAILDVVEFCNLNLPGDRIDFPPKRE